MIITIIRGGRGQRGIIEIIRRPSSVDSLNGGFFMWGFSAVGRSGQKKKKKKRKQNVNLLVGLKGAKILHFKGR